MPRRPLASALLLAALCAGAEAPRAVVADDAPAAWDGTTRADEVKKAIKEAFDATPDRRAEIRTLLEGLGPLKPADVKRWTKVVLDEMDRHGPKFPAKSGETFTYGGLTGPVFTAGKPRRGGALFLALHGGGQGVGDGKEALQKWSMVQSKAFVIAPTAPELRDSAWCQEDIERWVLALVEAARRTYDLDADHVYVAGHSMGGYGTWSIGCRHADRFAALGACAGGIFVVGGQAEVTLAPGHLPNLLNTPIWFYNSTDDKQVRPDSSQAADRELKKWKDAGYPYVWTFDEYTDIGHGLPPKGLKPISDWMLERKRDPAPRRVVFEPSRASKRRLDWLGVEGDGKVEGRIDGQTIAITGGSGAVTVFLNDRLVDVLKPVTITKDGQKAFEGLVPARLSVIVDGLVDERDPGLVVDRAVTVP